MFVVQVPGVELVVTCTPHYWCWLCIHWCLSAEFEEAAELLSVDPGASTLSMSASNTTTVAGGGGGGEEVKLDLSEDEEGQEESSEVCKIVCTALCHHDTGQPVLSQQRLTDVCASSC